MLKDILYFMPCIVCLMWSMILALKKRNRPQNYLLTVLSMGTVYYAAYAIAISPSTDYSQMAYLMALCQYLVPVWMIIHLLFVESHLKAKLLNNFARFCFFIPVCVHGSIMSVVYYMIDMKRIASYLEMDNNIRMQGLKFFPNVPEGFEDEIYRIYHFTAEKEFHGLCLFLCICTFAMGIIVMKRLGYKPMDVTRFVFKKGEIPSGIMPSYLIMLVILLQCPLMLFGRSYMVSCPRLALCITLLEAICIFCMGYVEYLSDGRTISIYSLKNMDLMPGVVHTDVHSDITDDDDELRTIEINDDEAEEIIILSDKITSLMDRLQKAFEEDKVYKKADLTLPMLAEMLNTNRTTLATVLKFKYKMTFKEYLAQCRIEMAKRYMLSHPDDVMELVADSCGFAGASSFSHKFKDEVGVSPKVWLQNQLIENRTNKVNTNE